jgi:hypothetical protein
MDFQLLVPHLDHVPRFQFAAAAGFDLAVDRDFSGLDQDLRLAAGADEARRFERPAQRRAFRDLQRDVSCGTDLASA